jgi:hypothetical protein
MEKIFRLFFVVTTKIVKNRLGKFSGGAGDLH